MRIVAVADTHLEHGAIAIPDGDVFVHAGDLCESGSWPGGESHIGELEAAAAWIRRLPHPTKIVIAGNHDWAFVNAPEQARELLAAPGVIYLEDAPAVVGGVRFYGSPWQPEFCDWAFNLPRGPVIAEKWAAIPEGTDVLITHGPPYGFGDAVARGRVGCMDLLERVEALRPLLHYFGHIHEDGGVWTREGTTYVNCTTGYAARGATVIDLDPVTRAVRPVVVPPRRRGGDPCS